MISRRQTAGIWNKDVEVTTGCKRKLQTRKANVIMEHIHAVKNDKDANKLPFKLREVPNTQKSTQVEEHGGSEGGKVLKSGN